MPFSRWVSTTLLFIYDSWPICEYFTWCCQELVRSNFALLWAEQSDKNLALMGGFFFFFLIHQHYDLDSVQWSHFSKAYRTKRKSVARTLQVKRLLLWWFVPLCSWQGRRQAELAWALKCSKLSGKSTTNWSFYAILDSLPTSCLISFTWQWISCLW